MILRNISAAGGGSAAAALACMALPATAMGAPAVDAPQARLDREGRQQVDRQSRPASSVKPGPLPGGGYVSVRSPGPRDLVTFIQRRVSRSGFPTRVDGVYGPNTEAAVRRFQAARRLLVDGIVGRQTITALKTPAGTAPGIDAPEGGRGATRPKRRVKISKPARSAISGTVLVRAKPQRAKARVRAVTFHVDGRRRRSDRRPRYDYLLASRRLSNGRHRLTVRAIYADGYVASTTKVVTVRNPSSAAGPKPARPSAPSSGSAPATSPSKPPDPNAPVPSAGEPKPPANPPPPPPAVDVGAITRDFELGNLTGWQLVQRVAEDRIRTVGSPVRQGLHAARFEVRHGDHVNGEQNSRAELGYTTELASEGQEQTYSWSTMLASDYPSAATWQDVVQWKNQGTGSPPLQIKVEGEKISLSAGSQLNWRNVWSAPLVRGEWLDFSLRVKWSSNPAVGWVELSYRGKQVLERYPMATLYPGLSNYLKLGLYRNASITATGVVYHDDVRVATH